MDVDEFRTQTQAWLEANAQHFETIDPSDLAACRSFRAVLWDAGLLGITLPTEYGGRGLTAAHQQAYAEAASRYRMPPIGEAVTTGICAPTLLDFGSEEQKKRHLRRMIRGDEVWTQLLSEPGAGSDLAGLETKATADGDTYVLNGQKVWTSGALESDYALCVARTDPDRPKHQGLSMFIVDLELPGVTIRPLRQMNGASNFNEVFFDDVRVSGSAIVGRENDGWRALTAMLTHERLALGAGTGVGGANSTARGSGWSGPTSGQFIELARRRGLSNEPVVRQELAKLYVAEKVLSFLAQKMRHEIAAGFSVGAKGSMAKLATAALVRQSSNLGMALAGPAAVAWDPSDPDGMAFADATCTSAAAAIAGGTSEIQRNTLGERVLGLPKEPQVDRDLPFRDIIKNPVARAGR